MAGVIFSGIHSYNFALPCPCRDGWEEGAPNALADPPAAHAVDVVRSARLYPTAQDAVADLQVR
jgi:hypothetical protein